MEIGPLNPIHLEGIRLFIHMMNQIQIIKMFFCHFRSILLVVIIMAAMDDGEHW